jgi:diguanylate cyclase (GGDEF)-like protein
VVTVSIGVACRVPALGHTVEQLIHDADTALYVAKQNGRNRVEVSVGISPEEAELLRQPGAVGRG